MEVELVQAPRPAWMGGRVLLGGIVGAGLLGLGVGLWARAATGVPHREPPPALRVVLAEPAPAPAPVGPLLDVMPAAQTVVLTAAAPRTTPVAAARPTPRALPLTRTAARKAAPRTAAGSPTAPRVGRAMPAVIKTRVSRAPEVRRVRVAHRTVVVARPLPPRARKVALKVRSPPRPAAARKVAALSLRHPGAGPLRFVRDDWATEDAYVARVSGVRTHN